MLKKRVTAHSIEIYADTRTPGECQSCRARLIWATIAGTCERLPFTARDFRVLDTREDVTTKRLIERADRKANHWATCDGKSLFEAR